MFDGLTSERIGAEVREAFQSVVYLLLDVNKIVITSEVEHDDAWKLLYFLDGEGRFCGGLLDLIWAKWRDGEIPTKLGEHELSIELPRGWRWSAGGKMVPNVAMATVQVKGVVLTDTGKAEAFTLWDADSGEFDRVKIDAMFPVGQRTLPVTWVHSEEELDAVLSKPSTARITVGRIPFPRLRYMTYWPPSQRAMDTIGQHVQGHLRSAWWQWWLFKRRFDPVALVAETLEAMTIEEIEGTDLGAIWESIAPSHPAARNHHWPFSRSRIRRADSRITVRPRRRAIRDATCRAPDKAA